jgi:hypothetical protein
MRRIRNINLLSHWIQTAHWLEDKSIAFALSNNSICLWKDSKIASTVLCPIKCIMYPFTPIIFNDNSIQSRAVFFLY